MKFPEMLTGVQHIGVPTNAVGKPGAIDHIALDTTDIEAAFAAAKEAGLTMLDDEIHGLPFWANGVKFFTVKGPNGEKVEFCQKL